MSLEHRNGRTYYYRARRENGRVVKEYVGSGFIAVAAAELDAVERLERAPRWANESDGALEWAAADAALADLDGQIARALEGQGLHRPKRGAWRRRR